LIFEHIIWSAAFAILVGTLVERKWGYVLPIWIIWACCSIPDIDYIFQTFMFKVFSALNLNSFVIYHGDFHNIVMIIVLALVFAWALNKYLKIDYNDAFICVFLGSAFHVFCDYIVYTQPFCPISPRFICEIHGLGLFTETGSWHGIGEVSIFVAGVAFLLISFCLRFYYSENKWIETSPAYCDGV